MTRRRRSSAQARRRQQDYADAGRHGVRDADGQRGDAELHTDYNGSKKLRLPKGLNDM